jgi:nucleotide-binding universal stress UspA family protein
VDFEVVLVAGMTDSGSISAAICEKAEELQAYAVVLSSHRNNMISKLFFGSVCDSTLQNCAVPICVLH